MHAEGAPGHTPERRGGHPWWLWPLAGGVFGIVYGFVDLVVVDNHTVSSLRHMLLSEEFVDLVLPVLLSIGAGFGVNRLLHQARVNAQLSLENAQLARHVLTSTLIAQILHEIRNPVHNLSAVLDAAVTKLPEAEQHIVQRNLKRLEHLTAQYSRWGALQDTIDPAEPVELRAWLQEFVGERVRPMLRAVNVQLVLQADPIHVLLHPILLEQICTTLCVNAFEAMARTHSPQRLTITAHRLSGQPARAALRLDNTGSAFPAHVLELQGQQPVPSGQGLGLGLMLVRKILEQVDGQLQLSNEEGRATALVTLPARAA